MARKQKIKIFLIKYLSNNAIKIVNFDYRNIFKRQIFNTSMEAVIVNYRMGRHRQYNNQMIIQVNNLDNREKTKHLIGKRVLWLSPTKKELTVVIKKEHGNNGALRAVFDKGLPGQALGTKVEIMEK